MASMKMTIEIEVGTSAVPTVADLQDALNCVGTTLRRRGMSNCAIQNLDGCCVGRMSVSSDPLGSFEELRNRR
jgi:hypothetical protein